jgi:predicted phosphodiesterase
MAVSLNRPGPIVENRRVAALYDIHGNLPALEAVVRELRHAGADAVVVGGDVLPGPMPRESLELVHSLDVPVHFIRGNGERESLALLAGQPTTMPEQFRESVRWSAEQLSPVQRDFAGSWPLTTRLDIAGIGPVLFCHATPRNDTDIFTRLTADDRLLAVFADLDVALVVCGHTHMQFDRTVGRVRIVNAGSIGMPFGAAGADWLLLGPDVELRHTDYDLAAAAARIRQTRYPQAEPFVTQHLLEPPAEAKMLETFAAAELK